jgi:hypothetical protein
MAEDARQTIYQLFNSSVSDSNLVFEFNLFDRSVSRKLWSTEYYRDKLMNLDIYDESWVQPNAADTQFSTSPASQGPLLDIEGYCRKLNLLLDGFFMNSMSVLDTLAHQISTIYVFRQRPVDLYIISIKGLLLSDHPNSKVGRLLDRQLAQRWFIEFRPFRHCTTHESIIRHDDLKITYDPVSFRLRVSKIKLPDDPQVRPLTYRRNREATWYCTTIFNHIQWLVIKAYENILSDIHKAKDVLPIPIPIS